VLPVLHPPDDRLPDRAATADRVATAFLLGYSNPGTREGYARDLRSWWDWCDRAGIEVLDARRPHLDLYARGLEAEDLAPATVARRLAVIAGFYAYAVEEGVLARSPAAHTKRPKVGEESPRLGLDREEARALLDAASESVDAGLVCLLLLNGLRVSEAISARVEDLEQVRGHRVLRVRGKGGRVDQVPLAPRTAGAIDRLLAGRTDGFLLAPEGMSRYQAARAVRRLAKAAGITKIISPHSLRHTAVTLALDSGVSLRDVQDLARHADPRTTRRYDRARGALDRHATYALASYLA
jgi:integrase/recombinase XerD